MNQPTRAPFWPVLAVAAILVILPACTPGTPSTPDSASLTAVPESQMPVPARVDPPALEEDEPLATDDVAAEPAAEPSPAPPPAVARWLLHSHRTAMLIEVRADLGEAEAALARVIAQADRDQDGRTTWEELAEVSDVFPRSEGNDALPPDLMRTYDTDGDDTVDGTELRRFLARGELVLSGWLAIQVDRRYERQLDSPTFRWLDQDNSGRLSMDEVEQSPQRLLETDADDDGLVWPADLAPLTPNLQLLPTQRTMSSANARRYVCAIDEQTDWEELLFELEQRFSFGGALTTQDLPQSCTLSQLDADGDDAISLEELQRLRSISPDLILEVRWNPPQLALIDNETSNSTPNYVHTTLNGVAVELFLTDTNRLPSFDEVDRDQDGVVEPAEFDQIGSLSIRFESVDTDGNEIVDRDEFAFAAEVIDAIAQVFVNARVFRSDDPLFAVLDVDKNARLDTLEIKGAIELLRPLQTEQDAELDPNALAASISIALSNGLTNPNPITLPDRGDDDGTPSAPTWFTEMDLDGNGRISRSEFVGTSAQFDALDKDQDGLITVEEAAGASQADGPT